MSLPTAVIRNSPEDFVVEELPAYPPSGRGEHLFVTFRKVSLTTPNAVHTLARALGADPRRAGFAGMKDRHAITTQTASFHLPRLQDPEALLANAALPGITVLAVSRHDAKLKPGHLKGNRFHIILRDIDDQHLSQVCEQLNALDKTGIPNAFGPQRFGKDGDNPARALAWIAGHERGPRDRRDQKLLFSALQSFWFNQLLARREQDNTWNTILAGDLAKRHDSGGLFPVPLDGPELDQAQARVLTFEISPTGPMFGSKMRWPLGVPEQLERQILTASIGDPQRLDAFSHAGEGTRRSLRLQLQALSVRLVDAPSNQPSSKQRIAVSFVLPKGGYATTVLGRAVRLLDASTVHRAAPEAQDDEDASALDALSSSGSSTSNPINSIKEHDESS